MVPAPMRIPLSKGLFTVVDADDFVKFGHMAWRATKKGSNQYAIGNLTGEKQNSSLHRLILNAPNGVDVDHKNRDTLDNRRSNLRLATRQQNNFNRTKRKGCTSIYKGVHWHKQKGKWQARIVVDRKTRSLGLYSSEIEAARMYDQAAIQHFGEFANPNFK